MKLGFLRKTIFVTMLLCQFFICHAGERMEPNDPNRYLNAVREFADKSSPKHDGVIYRNPRVYNVEYSFEMTPDPNKIDRAKDLKVWIPVPREWDSQRAVKIISIEPKPNGKYVDPEYGNPMLFWDFGKDVEMPSYKVSIKYRLEQYEVYADIDPNRIGRYDTSNKDYIRYTHSTHSINIDDKVKELARIAVGNERNPYLQVSQINEFVREKMCYIAGTKAFERRVQRSHSVNAMLESPMINLETGDEYYIGDCVDYSSLLVALCRAIGIPARRVISYWDYPPWIRKKPEELEHSTDFPDLWANGLARSRHLGCGVHVWAEVHLPNYGWIPVDPTFGRVGHSNIKNHAVIITKGYRIQIGQTLRRNKTQAMEATIFFFTRVAITCLQRACGTLPRSTKLQKVVIYMEIHSRLIPWLNT